MKLIIVLCLFVGCAVCVPIEPRPDYKQIELEALDTEIEDGGKYHYRCVSISSDFKVQ